MTIQIKQQVIAHYASRDILKYPDEINQAKYCESLILNVGQIDSSTTTWSFGVIAHAN